MSDDKPYPCERCGTHLGEATDDGRLVTDNIVIEGGSVFYCRFCGHRRKWNTGSYVVDEKLNQIIADVLRLRRDLFLTQAEI